jgi:hypothetical protein
MKLKEIKIEDFAERLKNIGLTNSQGNSMEFIKRIDNPHDVGGEIYIFVDADVDYGKLNDATVIRGLRNIFRGLVRPDPGQVYGEIQFFVKPSAKIKCNPLTAEDTWIVRSVVHAGIFGAPGKGKTTGIAFLLNLYCIEAENKGTGLEIHLFDQKPSFAQKLGVSDSASFYYGTKGVLSGLEQIVEQYEQIKFSPDGVKRLVCIDEYITLVDRLDNKQTKHLHTLLGTLIYEAREFGYSVILAGQASHAERFGAGMRDCLTSRIFFGSPSSDGEKKMLFPNDVGLMDAHNACGELFMQIDGMEHVERFSIVDAVPDFAEIGERMRKYMK